LLPQQNVLLMWPQQTRIFVVTTVIVVVTINIVVTIYSTTTMLVSRGNTLLEIHIHRISRYQGSRVSEVPYNKRISRENLSKFK